MATTLNMQLLLRRDNVFTATYKLAAGEPGFEISTNTLKIGDGVKTWAELPIANKEQIDAILTGYKTVQDAIAKVETDTNVFIDTIAQNANGEISITTKAVDFSAADDRFKALQTAIEAVATAKNTFIDTIAQDAQGVITITTKAVDFGDYRTSAEQDEIDAGFKTKQAEYANAGNTLKTITNVIQNANGEITVTYEDIAVGAVAENDTGFVTGGAAYTAIEAAKDYAKDLVDNLPEQTDYTVTCTDEEVEATETAGAYKRHTLSQNGKTVCTIDVPRDLVIKSGRVDASTDELVLVLVNDEEIRVDVSHLIEYVTGDTAEDGVITVNVSDDFVATATINDGTITSAKFADEVDTYVDNRIDNKINTLDVTDITGFGASKTLATLTETDGKIAATFQDIAITKSQITDFVESDYKTKQTAKEAIATDTNVFAYGVSQDENGVVTVKTKAVDFSEYTTTYTVEATENPLEFTVTPSKGEVQTVTLVAPTVDVGVTSVVAGTDITVSPEDGTGTVTVAHKAYESGTVKDVAHDSATDPSFITGIEIENGHVTGAKVRNLAEVLNAMEFILDCGTSK